MLDLKLLAADVRLAQGGDPNAMNRILTAVQDMVYYNCLRMLKNEQQAQDAAQDILITVYTRLSSLADPQAYLLWVKRITANECKNRLSKVNREFLMNATEDGSDPFAIFEDIDEQRIPDKALDNEETRRMINELVDRLPDEQRVCVMLYYYDEMKTREIAEALNVSEGTIKSRLNYARKSIKEGVIDYEKQGIKLYGLSPILFLGYFLRAAGSSTLAPFSVSFGTGAAAAAAGATAAGSAAGSAAGTASATAAAGAAAAAGTTAAGAATGTTAASSGIGAFLATAAGKVVAAATAAVVLTGAVTGTVLAVNKSTSRTAPKQLSAEQKIVEYLDATNFRSNDHTCLLSLKEEDNGAVSFTTVDDKQGCFDYFCWTNLDDDPDHELLIEAHTVNKLTIHSLDGTESTELQMFDRHFSYHCYLALDWDRESNTVRERRLTCLTGESVETLSVLENGLIRMGTYVSSPNSFGDYSDEYISPIFWYRAERYWSPFTDTVRNAMQGYGKADQVFVNMMSKQVECAGFAGNDGHESFRFTYDYYSPEVDALGKTLPKENELQGKQAFYLFRKEILRKATDNLTTRSEEIPEEYLSPIHELGPDYMKTDLTLDANGGSFDGQPIMRSQTMNCMFWFQPIPTREGYVFTHWSTDPDGQWIVYGGDTAANEDADVTVYANWTPDR